MTPDGHATLIPFAPVAAGSANASSNLTTMLSITAATLGATSKASLAHHVERTQKMGA